MNRIIPFVFVVAFWVLYYLGMKYPGAGDTIAILTVLCLLMLILYSIKTYIFKMIMNNK